jgi:hypothetical protein
MSDTPVETKTKSKRTPKPKVDKYNGFKVPTRSRKSTKWTIYLYEMIKEAKPELLSVDLVKDAYNNLVECLIKYENTFESWLPPKYYKYTKTGNGVILKNELYNNNSGLMGIPGRWTYTWEQQRDPLIIETMKKGGKDITDTYTVLYELIKRDIVPYMETKQHEVTSKKDIESYHNYMEKLERDIKTYEAAIVAARKTLCEYAEKALKLQQPPVLTKFD